MRRLVILMLALAMNAGEAQQPARVLVYAAGSLRAPLTEIARTFENPGRRVELVFGASGLLRDRIRAGESAQVFASANMEHPRSLAASGWGETRAFTRNALCALAPAQLALTPEILVATLLDPRIKVGTSTPRSDPSGDYAFEMFARIGRMPQAPPDAQVRLEAKALQLTGGPTSPQPPAGRSVYAQLVAQGEADVFITYCTNAFQAVSEEAGLRVTDVPAAVNVTADYGLAVRVGSTPDAGAFAAFVLSPAGQAVLRGHGFKPVE